MRLAEIFELVNNELKLVGKSGKLPAGAAITGAGAKIPDIVELAKQELKLPAQLGIPELSDVEFVSGKFKAQLEDSEFSVCTGLLFWAIDQSLKDQKLVNGEKRFNFKNFKIFSTMTKKSKTPCPPAGRQRTAVG